METKQMVGPENFYFKKIKFVYYFSLVYLHYYMRQWLLDVIPVISIIKHFSFLTIISLYLNYFYYSYSLLLETKIGSYIINHRFLTDVFKFAYVISFVVFLLFWTILFIDPNLLRQGEIILPFYLNIFLHGANYILNLIEHTFVSPKPNSSRVNFKFYIVFSITYGVHLQILNLYGITVYPLVNQLSILQYSIVMMVSFLLTMAGDCTHHILMRKELKKIQ
jgi:hypothetical protein